MGIQMTGMASGMDTNSMVQKIMEVERKPIYLKQREIMETQQKKKEWQEIEKKIKNLKSSASDLKFSSTFEAKKISSTNEAKASATAVNSAANTSYVLEDIKLAKPGKVTSDKKIQLKNLTNASIETRLDNIKTGNIRFFNLGIKDGKFKINGTEIEYYKDDTVNLLLNRINKAKTGVKATFEEFGREFKLEAIESNGKIKVENSEGNLFKRLGLDKFEGKEIKPEGKGDFEKAIIEVPSLKKVQDGFFSINGYTFQLNKRVDTLSSIINEINTSEAGVTAFFDKEVGQLTLTAKEAGQPVVLQNDTSDFLKTMGVMNASGDSDWGLSSSMYEGAKASFKLNGVKMEKDLNKFSISGVNFDLRNATSEGEQVTITIDSDNENILEKIKKLIDDYNEAARLIQGKIQKDAVLQSDSTANSLFRKIRKNMTDRVAGVDKKYDQLAMIGVTAESSKSSILQVDAVKLKEALDENQEAVKRLFTQVAGVFGDDEKDNEEVIAVADGKSDFYTFEKLPSDLKDLQLTVEGKPVKLVRDSDEYHQVRGWIWARNRKHLASDEALIDEEKKVIMFPKPVQLGKKISFQPKEKTNSLKKVKSDGIAVRIESYLKPFSEYKGTLDRQLKLYDDRVKDMNSWISKTNNRLQMREESLKKQFGSMESAVQTSNSQGAWLSGQIAGL